MKTCSTSSLHRARCVLAVVFLIAVFPALMTAQQPELTLRCESELDSLVVDPVHGAYVQDAFNIWAFVGNVSGRSVYNVQATAMVMSSGVQVLAPAAKAVAQQIDHGMPELKVEWDVRVAAQEDSGWVEVLILLSGEDAAGDPLPTKEVLVRVFLPGIARPAVMCEVGTSVSDPPGTPGGDITVEYVYDEENDYADYEGEPSAFGDYTVFTVRVRAVNLGEAVAKNVRALLLMGSGYLVLEDSEAAQKRMEPEDIPPRNGLAVAEWKLRPLGVPEDTPIEICVLITGDDLDPVRCCIQLILAAAPRLVMVSMPKTIAGSYRDIVSVPIEVGTTLGRNVRAYRLTVRHNPAHLRFVAARSEATLTEEGWVGPQAEALTEPGAEAPNLVRVQAETTRKPLSTSQTGPLVLLDFEVVHNRESLSAADYVTSSVLEFVPDVTVVEGNRRLLHSMNSVSDDSPGNIGLATKAGFVTVSGDCIIPLKSRTWLAGNAPNPCNPTTTVAFSVGQAQQVHIVLYDRLGREVGVLYDGVAAAGRHEVPFNTGQLSSGVYFYRMQSGFYSATRTMVVQK